MTEKTDYAATHKYAPNALRTKWNQMAFKKTHEHWSEHNSNEYRGMQSLTREDGLISVWMVFRIINHPDGIGDYGRDKGFRLDYTLDRHHLVDENIESKSLERFGEDLLNNIYESIEEDCPDMLSMKEYMVYTCYQTATERDIADAFDIDIGTVRGKIGRVRDKISSARNLYNFSEDIDKYNRIDRNKYVITPEAAEMVSEEELPIATTSNGENNVIPIPVKEYVDEEFDGDDIRDLEKRYYD
jgi:hypothetical protein